MKKTICAIMMAVIALMACGNKKAEQTNSEETKEKVLVLYYSQTGATKAVAEEIQKQLEADIEAIELEQPYDGDFGATIARCQQEKADSILPTMKALKKNIADYDVVFLGYPVWFGTYASPIASLLKEQNFEGKKVVTFCTFGSGGLQTSTKDVKEALPKADVAEGYGVRNARISAVADELNRFLIEAGYKKGEVEALPAFMEHKPVTEAETDIFNQACGDYQMPLGTPVDFAVRETSTSTDYEFGVSSTDQAGNPQASTIYVTISKEEGAKPEFTQVVR